MDERDIFDGDVLRILQKGGLRGEIEQARERNEWKLKIVHLLRGHREAGVVTKVFSDSTKLLVKTVEWEDL